MKVLAELEDERDGQGLEGHAGQVDVVEEVEVHRAGMSGGDVLSVEPESALMGVQRLLDRVPAG